jgi:hypothetical protein
MHRGMPALLEGAAAAAGNGGHRNHGQRDHADPLFTGTSIVA